MISYNEYKTNKNKKIIGKGQLPWQRERVEGFDKEIQKLELWTDEWAIGNGGDGINLKT